MAGEKLQDVFATSDGAFVPLGFLLRLRVLLTIEGFGQKIFQYCNDFDGILRDNALKPSIIG